MKTYQIKKVDVNQPQLVSDLRRMGYSVCHTHTIGQGVPDLIVSDRVYMIFVEVKSEGQELNDREKQWWVKWNGVTPVLAYKAEDVVEAFKLHEKSNRSLANR